MYMYIRKFNSNGEQYDYQVMDTAVTTINDLKELQEEVASKGGHIEVEFIRP